MRTARSWVATLLAGALTAAVGVPAECAEPVRLRVQSGFNRNVPVLGETIWHVASLIETGGRSDVQLHVYDAGKLVPTLQIFDAVASGKLDAGFAWPGYWMGKLPATTVFGAVPFGPEAGEYLAWLHEGGGLELWRELYAPHGLAPVPCGVLPPEASGWFARPIESVDDLRGLKIRYAGLGGEVLARLGASITMLAGSDIFPSLERGVIDATEFSIPSVDRALGFFLDWIEITLIVLPLVYPLTRALGIEPVWFTMLMAVCLQTSFLTPPVGPALFYLQGVAPPGVELRHLYPGVLPFVCLQLLGLAILFAWPELVTWLPDLLYR